MKRIFILICLFTFPVSTNAMEPEKKSRIAQLEEEVVETTELCDPEEKTEMPTFY